VGVPFTEAGKYTKDCTGMSPTLDHIALTGGAHPSACRVCDAGM
jgi:hypothetical protein